MKTRYYVLIALISTLSLSCQKAPKSKEDTLGDFAKSVLIAGKAKDSNTLVSKLSMATVADGKAFMELLKKSNPELTFTEGEANPKDEDLRKEMEINARLFIDSYADVFDGTLSCIITAQDPMIKAANVYSMIIWVKQKDGKYRGIKIDNLWTKSDGTIQVLTWAQLSGYYGDKNVTKKQAMLLRDTVEACNFPNMIEYKYVFTD